MQASSFFDRDVDKTFFAGVYDDQRRKRCYAFLLFLRDKNTTFWIAGEVALMLATSAFNRLFIDLLGW